jgi:hypothetical protein
LLKLLRMDVMYIFLILDDMGPGDDNVSMRKKRSGDQGFQCTIVDSKLNVYYQQRSSFVRFLVSIGMLAS